MRKIVLLYGSISGVLMIVNFLVTMTMMHYGMNNTELVGYASMIVVLSVIFFGIKSFRDKNNNGLISFGKGFQVGLLITSIASIFYATGWEAYYNGVPGVKETFMDKYIDSRINKMKQEGKSQEMIDATKKEMNNMKEMYTNPFIRYGMTLAEIFPVGVVIALISAGILRKKNVLPV